MANKNNEWVKNELGDAVLGDKRLTDQPVNIVNSLTSLPESSINQGIRKQQQHIVLFFK
jgi:hypothetical protein